MVLLVGLSAAHRTVFAHWCLERGLRAGLCDSATQALEASRSSAARAVIVSADVRDGPATRFCEALRQRGFGGAVLCVSRVGSLDLEAAVLRAGADDFVASEPVQRLLARADALLRRGSGMYSRVQQLGTIVIDHDRRVAYVSGKPTNLTPTEFAVLSYLASNRERFVSAEELGREVLGAGMGRANVKRHVSRIRSKLRSARNAIATLRGAGYRFDSPFDAAAAR